MKSARYHSQRGRERPTRLRVNLDRRSYDLIIGDRMLGRAGEALRRSGIAPSSRLFTISSRKILRLHGSRILDPLRREGWDVEEILVPDGEKHKTLESAARIFDALARRRADRSSVIVAFGGGVIGDLAGFVAATYLRGIRFVQVPTTLLAAIDSSVGGKTGVDLGAGKNLVGAFHQPRLVLTDLTTLRTLPRRQVCSGMYEAIKCGVIADRAFFKWMEDSLPSLLAISPADTQRLVARCCAIKARVVERDERESGLRRILNFGHTFGHALEAELNYRRLTHGEAVGLGMQMAADLATSLGILATSERDRIVRLVRSVGPSRACGDLKAAAVYRRMLGDKKATSGNIHFVLPRRIGEVEIRSNVVRAQVITTLKRFGLR